MIPELEQILTQFKPISLKEMNRVELMNRTDRKFFFHISKLHLLLSSIQNQYKILTINNIRSHGYETLYFDTPDFFMYQQHHRGKANRVKVRTRTYCNSGLHFFEIKHKTNKGRTVKERINTPENGYAISPDCKQFIDQNTSIDCALLSPALKVKFNRITLVNNIFPERITIDYGLEYIHPNTNQSEDLSSVAIIELKQDKLLRSDMDLLLHQMHIQKRSFSKYCIGVSLMYQHIRKNNFKPQIFSINKIRHENN